ncbi:50S ribosomal protein L29 [Rickettsiales endosymbiont of Stachyamoeba lipophora]|uniref:50S ribosomal protein L29 n=1 Tax=Rickettsiales endosymbiont of Stachyamoeba lipophora TaxID=2486578 RepID=UPI000F653B92|nr:50S ribosomal protein L29 [Rickettsiales endosymbiont of Stachyamoeba lipophora]AZL15872.1 50S ribosomal protein L29 [Rickettsiales endosymbiont of Stachyamoeba lipophora]
MANKKMQEINSCAKEQILEQLKMVDKEMMNIRFQRVTSEFKNTARIRDLKKQKARLLTLFNQKFKRSKSSA